jgi:hypothetical protein
VLSARNVYACLGCKIAFPRHVLLRLSHKRIILSFRSPSIYFLASWKFLINNPGADVRGLLFKLAVNFRI